MFNGINIRMLVSIAIYHEIDQFLVGQVKQKAINLVFAFCGNMWTVASGVMFRVMALNATFNNIKVISRLSVLFMEETGENHQSVASH
jgi:hypothetical protein